MSIENFENIPLSTSEFSTAGRVNFNACASNDYPTNEAFKTLRSNILFCGTDKKVILITSTIENEGKSTIATELSKSLSEINKKTLLIDADMRKSVILRRNLKTQGILGLSELLSGQATISQVLYNTQMPNFDVIFSGHFPPNPVELLSGDTFKEVLDKFKSVYDYIIIDSPPLGPVIDAAVISVNCDGAIMVIASNKAKSQDIVSVKEQLLKSGCDIIGVVLNESDSRHSINSRYHKSHYGYYGKDNKRRKR